LRHECLEFPSLHLISDCNLFGAADTPLLRYHLRNCPEDEQRILSKIPLWCFATPEDIAKGVCFLASSDAFCITWTWLLVDGTLLAQG
jgi:NAD(P)-dependent dehydrogenase (short-subunit alcohol dehydrogenase family)